MKKLFVGFGQNAVDQNAEAYQGWAGLLSGCVNDARDLAQVFNRLGYESHCLFSGWNVGGPRNPWEMTGQCTLGAWHELHVRLQGELLPGDTAVIANSGHGYQYPATGVFSRSGEGMCFWDGLLPDYEFHKMMCGWPTGVNVIYILDTCFSGGNDKVFGAHRNKAMPSILNPRAAIERPEMRSSDIAARVLQLCASAPDQTSADGQFNGAFTGSSLSVVSQAWNMDDGLTWRRWLNLTKQIMSGHWPQVPQLNILGAGDVLADARIAG